MYQQVHQKSDLIAKQNVSAVFCTVAAGEAINIHCTAEGPEKSEEKENEEFYFFLWYIKSK